ncbi:MAG: hypothetical protein HPY50_00220 [Firmicutes bacterium]|nr:hypothetical protein [Bacillota bacterium]
MLTFQLILTLVLSNVLTFKPWDDKISQGAFASNVEIGGMPPAQAAEVLSRSFEDSLNNRVVLLTDGERNWSVSLSDINFKPDFNQTVDAAYNFDHQGSVSERLTRSWTLRQNQADFPLQGTFDTDKMVTLLNQIDSSTYREPQSSRIESPDGNLVIVKEQLGRRLNLEASLDQIRQDLNAGLSTPIPLVFDTLEPTIRESDLHGIHQIMAIYTTIYNPNDVNRSTNVEIAARTINGLLVKPDQVFSLNESLGPRVAEKGYKPAPVFSNQKLVKDIGGGICQVATTLYNALLQTRLEITERWPHSSPITYAPLGLDATLAGNTYDLKFLNNTGVPVYISATAEKGIVTVTIYGTAGEGQVTRRIVTEKEVVAPPTVVKYDQNLPMGESKVIQKGKEGYKVKVYRITEVAGQETGREMLSDNYYRPQPTIINTGDPGTETKGEMK